MKASHMATTFFLFSTGCVTEGMIRREAALTLECQGRIELTENAEYDKWIADGCGRRAICSLPEKEKRAAVFCAGGGPAIASH